MGKTLSIIGTLLVAILLVLGACAPTAPPPVRPEPLPPPTPAPLPSPAPEKPPTNVIEDLAYIKAHAGKYTDDADPEPEGIQIAISWYDTKGKTISFGKRYSKTKNVAILVDIELYQRRFDMKAEEYLLGRCIYKGEAQVNCAPDCPIKIPFEEINATYIPDSFRNDTLVKLTVHTPKQGDYSAETITHSDFGSD